MSDWPLWPLPLLVVLYAIFMLVVSTNVQFNFFVKAYNKNPDFVENAVALSFDDGPDENSMKILDILDKYEAKAVFFCIGKKIEEKPEIFREILKRGHIVGNHTFSHTRRMGFLSSKRILEEISECDRVAQEVGGVKMNLFRPPFGIINPKTRRALLRSGHTVIGWNVRPYDAITKSPQVIINRITKKLERGDLILLHDNREKTPDILEQLLVILKQRNFAIVRPDKLFNINAYN
ncbi:polysaccharide deacetylase family protein [Gramella sp. KN1008]|uniref:polysaccharide deacetylase family protein n=1 Tax=Gramella sp. KN1008 TaxID=2529298 RepID=UPI0013F14548|nr:polysaccharide deacetylase family protein [Gramella sp. KN1008]